MEGRDSKCCTPTDAVFILVILLRLPKQTFSHSTHRGSSCNLDTFLEEVFENGKRLRKTDD